jgi:acetolactate synthase-1/2/3 large subunit
VARKYGSDLIVDVMLQYGIEYAALNPGSSFRGLHDSIVNYAGNRPEIIECPHEKVAVGMAHGYAKVTGRPMVAIAHNVVGLLHASLGVYRAFCDRAPVIFLGATGPMDPALRRPTIDWTHTATAQGQAVRDFTKWDYQPVGAQDVVDSFARAYRVATTDPQGPVYLCYDAAFQEEPLTEEPVMVPPERALPTRLHPDPEALDRLAVWLVDAQNPVFVADYSGRRPEAVSALVALAELLGAAVLDTAERPCFPNEHPLDLTGDEDAVLAAADVVVALDVRDLYGAISRGDLMDRRSTESLLRPGTKLVEIGFGDVGIRSWAHDFEKLQPCDLSILGDVTAALKGLLPRCRRRMGDAEHQIFERRGKKHAVRHAELRAGWAEQARAAAADVPIATAHLASVVGESIRDQDWVLTANTCRGWARRLWSFDRPDRHPGNSIGTATDIGLSLGVALAHRGSGRLVVDIQPDGDLMFDASSLWIAAHHQIPMLIVMFNNRSYYNDQHHQVAVARQRGRDEAMAYLGLEIDRPAPDFATVARGFGWWSEGPVTRPGDLRGAVDRARDVVLKEGRPALVDVVCQYR